MNENKMLYWIENIWTKRERISNSQSLLVLNSFSVHIVDSVKRHFDEKNTNIAVIPGGLTSCLQPLDVSVNKSFKTKMRRNYNEWMVEAAKGLTPAVDVDLIRKSFKCCGISNKRDGTEDDWIFNYNRLGQGNQPGDEVEIPLDDEHGNEEDKEGETDDEYVSEKEEMDEETDEEYVDEEEETDEEYIDEGGEEDEEGEYEGEEDGYDDEYYSHYDQRTNYVNVWDD
ncbi:hypothetical protein RclHR1_15640002 [Rhizophagus clarus]|uniref:Pogo transposable element with KRAB domain n=1 Tax=Rhizophagus clarus TaxID=94130 RepID=A0A2Z6QUU0_9GLOM|nr:hypothetical protein RclHR1_15640002 [Rhizophagus clarus]GET01737.1 pogo transposable element with KRAB domain [Rhizophagus clarus]